MKNAVRVATGFLLSLLVFSLILSSFEYLSWAAGSGISRFPLSFMLLALSLKACLPLTVALSLFSAFLLTRTKPGARIATYALLFLATAALLGLGTLGLNSLSGEKDPESIKKLSRDGTSPNTRSVLGANEGAVYIGSLEGDTAKELVLARFSDSSANLEFHALAGYRAETSEFFDKGSGMKIASLPGKAISGKFLAMPSFVEGIKKDVLAIIAKFSELSDKNILLCFAFAGATALILLACWPFSRLSSWPLVDAVICAFAMRGALFLCAILSSDTIRYIVISTLPGFPGDWTAPALIGFIGAAVIAIDFLIIPYSSFLRANSDIEEEE